VNKQFEFNAGANSPDLTDEEVASAIPTSGIEDIVPQLRDQICSCGKALGILGHKKLFRFPHFYWRARLVCVDGHPAQKVFQVTWLYEPTKPT
jgi:hypothetical protein